MYTAKLYAAENDEWQQRRSASVLAPESFQARRMSGELSWPGGAYPHRPSSKERTGENGRPRSQQSRVRPHLPDDRARDPAETRFLGCALRIAPPFDVWTFG